MANFTPKDLRQQIVTLLDDGTLVVVGQVFDSPVTPFRDGDRDVKICVFTDQGDTEVRSIQKFEGTRTIRLRLEVRADADPAVDGSTIRTREAALQAKVDDVVEAMLAKVLTNQDFWSRDKVCGLRRMDRATGQDVESQQLHAIVQATLHCEVRQTYKPSLAAAVDLKTIRVETDMIDPGSGPDGDIDSTILIEDLDV